MLAEVATVLGVAGLLQSLPDVSKYRTRNVYNKEIADAARRNGVNFYVLKGLVATESAFNPEAKAPTSSATGLTQVIRATANEVGIPTEYLTIPAYGAEAGARYLAKMQRNFGFYGGIKAYYSGPATYMKPSRNPKHARESVTYAKKVLSHALAFYLEDFGI